MKTSQLQVNEFAAFYAGYIEKAGEKELIDGLKSNLESSLSLYNSISEEKFNYSYAEGKWTIKEMLLHIIDAERVFAYRSLRIARQDKTDLPGFSQDDFVAASDASQRTKSSLINEYEAVRLATISLFDSFSNERLQELGKASGSTASPRGIGFIIIGHETHHVDILKERYL